MDEIALNDAKIVKITGSNSFAIKKLLVMDDTASNYLVYCPVSFEHPENNWLLNIELYSGEPFRADLNTIWMDEMGLPASQMLRKQVRQYHKFFNSKERRAKVAAMAGNINTPAQMHLAVTFSFLSPISHSAMTSYLTGFIRMICRHFTR